VCMCQANSQDVYAGWYKCISWHMVKGTTIPSSLACFSHVSVCLARIDHFGQCGGVRLEGFWASDDIDIDTVLSYILDVLCLQLPSTPGRVPSTLPTVSTTYTLGSLNQSDSATESMFELAFKPA